MDINLYILTDMKKLLVILDDETYHLLEKEKNKSAVVREAIKYIKQDITPDTIDGMRKSYAVLAKAIKELDSKVDFIAKRVQ